MAILTVNFFISAHAFNICGRQRAEFSQTSGRGHTTSLRLLLQFALGRGGKKNSCIYLECFTIKVPDMEATDSAKKLNKAGSVPFNGISEACRAHAGSKDKRDAPVKAQTDVITDASSCPFASSTVI